MSITFYAGSGSPFVWRVWLALEHKALAYDLKMLSFSAGDTRKPEFLKLNPHHKVPVIVDGEFTLYESTAIVEYLEDAYPASGLGPLFPSNPKQRAKVRRFIAEFDSCLFYAMLPIAQQLFFKPEAEWSLEKIDQGRQTFVEELAILETQIQSDYVAGDLSAADYTLYPIIAGALRLDLKKPDLKISTALGPNILAWKKRIETLPFLEKTRPPHWK